MLAILSVALLGLIIYFAVSSKSSRLLKLAAFIALGLIGLSLGVCGFFLLKGPAESNETIPLSLFQEVKPPAKTGNTVATVIFFIVFVLVLAVIIFLAIRDQKKKDKLIKNTAAFSAADELDIEDHAIREDDSFDIE